MLSNQNRLRKKKDFEKVYRQGRIIFGPLFNIRYIPNDFDYPRFAVVVSKKTASLSVKRNLLKRRIRSALRDLPHYDKNFDIVIVVKQSALKADYEDLKKELEQMLGKLFKK